MAHDVERFRTPDGLELAVHRWEPEAADAVCLVVHGYADHAGRYERLARALNDRNVAVWAPDLRGHGLSAGPRADVEGFDHYLADLRLVAERARERHPDLPLGLFGHSMGGALALLYVLDARDGVRALAVSGPYLRPAADPPAWLKRVVGSVAPVVPGLPVQPLSPAVVSRDPAAVEAYRTDPLVYHGWVKARMAHLLVSAGPVVLARAGEIVLPTLIEHGAADPLASPEASRQLARALGSDDVTLRLREGVLHEPLNDPEGDVIAAEIAEWLVERLRA